MSAKQPQDIPLQLRQSAEERRLIIPPPPPPKQSPSRRTAMSELFSIETSNSRRLSYFSSLTEALCAASDEVMDNDTVDVYSHALIMKLDSLMLCNALNGSPPEWYRRRICQMTRDNPPRVLNDCGSSGKEQQEDRHE